MITLLLIVYGSLISLVGTWVYMMFRSNRHFRSAIQHPSLTNHIRL